MAQTHNGSQVIDKAYFHYQALTNGAVNSHRMFQKAEGEIDKFLTNWPGGTKLPDNYVFALYKIGFDLRMTDGSALSDAVIAKIRRGRFRMVVKDREIRNGSLAEFFDYPVSVSAGQTLKTAKPLQFVPLETPEGINGGETIEFIIDTPDPGAAGVEIGAYLKGVQEIR